MRKLSGRSKAASLLVKRLGTNKRHRSTKA